MRRIVACLACLGFLAVGAACSSDDPIAAPTTTVTTTTTTIAAATTTTTTLPSPTRRVYKEDLEILDHGAKERSLLQYASNNIATPIHIEINTTYNDSYWAPGGRTSEIILIGQSVPTSDGIRLEITDGGSLDTGGLRFSESERDFSEDGLLFELVSDGGRVIQRRPGIEGATDDLLLGQPLRGFLIPLPDEPVGIGARWTYGETARESSEFSSGLELIAVNGPVITLQLSGTGGDYDGDHYGGNWLEVEHSGVFTLDLSSGRFTGEVWDIGTVQQSTLGVREGAVEPFERHTVIDVPARFTPTATESRSIDVVYDPGANGADDGVDVIWAGGVELSDDGSAQFTGEALPLAGSDDDAIPFDIRVLPDGTTTFGSTGGFPSPTFVYTFVPDFIDSAMLYDDEIVQTHSDLWLNISLGGYRAPMQWEVESIAGSQVSVVGSGDVDAEFFTRGAYNLIVGGITARFVLDLFDPYATNGRIAFEGTYNFTEVDQLDYREGWTLTTTPGAGALDSADG